MVAVFRIRLEHLVDKVERINRLEKLELVAPVDLPHVCLRYSIDSTCLPSSRGNKAFRRLMTRFLCSPKTFLNVTSAFGSRYFAIAFCPVSVQRHTAPKRKQMNYTIFLSDIHKGLRKFPALQLRETTDVSIHTQPPLRQLCRPPPSLSHTRSSSLSLHACAQQPFCACGASPSAISLI